MIPPDIATDARQWVADLARRRKTKSIATFVAVVTKALDGDDAEHLRNLMLGAGFALSLAKASQPFSA